jgi:hypothetical protein
MLRQDDNKKIYDLKKIVSHIEIKYEAFINQYKKVVQYQKDSEALDLDFTDSSSNVGESSEKKEERLAEAKHQLALLRIDLDKQLNTPGFYLGFPRKELWRLCIDQKYQNGDTKDNPFYFDERRAIELREKDYIEGVRYIFLEEPGYLYAMEKAFVLLEKTLHLPLSVELITALHDMSVSTLIMKDKFPTQKGIRTANQATVGLSENVNYTYEGIVELINLYKEYACIANLDTHEICENPDEICQIGGKSRFTRIDAANAKNFTFILQKFIDQYNNEIKKDLTSYQKIYAIAEFIHKCNILHPYHDANIRTFVFLIANRLLFENRFPLALFEEPNRFDGYSVNQLSLEIIKGMSHSIKITKTKCNLYELRAAAEKAVVIEIKNLKYKRKSNVSEMDTHERLPLLYDAKAMKFFSKLSGEISNISFNTKTPSETMTTIRKIDQSKNTQGSASVSHDTDYGFKRGFLMGKRF